ncbi:vacuolar sorting protein 9 domain-containing protein [Reticulomyxa filosa]|uniref:Vacuolar sorting protein 9 domain-containing protein n=1 Tax=Reticulomyxa filosa TaxID=46433 RepID=X6MZ11_RETFI|nr:vacuolar sorting protein 9 domain-containing protein [Reticulomyxa filosa]|eukprot:ETO18729.1 vacuolar sorting protein 9 domain-containing protein [Reticulomyxa filosa]
MKKVVERRTRNKYHMLVHKLSKLIGKQQKDFGIPEKDQRNDGWKAAIAKLKTLKQLHLPLDMIQCFMLTAAAIHNNKKSEQPIDADHFINIAIYVYVKSSTVKTPAITEAELLFIEGLMDKQTAMSEGGYYFTVFRSVVNWIYAFEEKKE